MDNRKTPLKKEDEETKWLKHFRLYSLKLVQQKYAY